MPATSSTTIVKPSRSIACLKPRSPVVRPSSKRTSPTKEEVPAKRAKSQAAPKSLPWNTKASHDAADTAATNATIRDLKAMPPPPSVQRKLKTEPSTARSDDSWGEWGKVSEKSKRRSRPKRKAFLGNPTGERENSDGSIADWSEPPESVASSSGSKRPPWRPTTLPVATPGTEQGVPEHQHKEAHFTRRSGICWWSMKGVDCIKKAQGPVCRDDRGDPLIHDLEHPIIKWTP